MEQRKTIQYNNVYWRNQHGQLHRTDGPAYVGPDGWREWWLGGHELPFYELMKWFRENNIDIDNMSKEDEMAFKLRWS